MDKAVVTYLATGTLSTDLTIHPHIIKAAFKLFYDPCGVLWARDKKRYPTQRIQPIGKRHALIEEEMMNPVYPNGEWLHQYLRE